MNSFIVSVRKALAIRRRQARGSRTATNLGHGVRELFMV
jgi:hypothetical protein